jgi:hypothetical protein
LVLFRKFRVSLNPLSAVLSFDPRPRDDWIHDPLSAMYWDVQHLVYTPVCPTYV